MELALLKEKIAAEICSALLKNSSDLYVAVDRHENILFSSAAFDQLPVSTQNTRELPSFMSKTVILGSCKHVLETGLSESFNASSLGSQSYKCSIKPIQNEQGAVVAALATCINTTHSALKILEAIIETTKEAIFVKDLEGRYLMINPTTAQLMQRTEQEVLGKDDRDFWPPEMATKIMKDDRDAIASGTIQTYEETYPIAGLMRTFLTTKGPYRNSRGEVIGLFCISHDITELKQKREELERLISLYRTALASTADGIMVVDKSDAIVGFNQRLIDLWNVPSSLMDGGWNYKIASDFVADQLKHPDACSRRLKEVLKDPETESYDVLELKNGRVFERYSRPQKVAGKTVGRVFSYRDITAKIQAEAALRESEARKTAILESALDSIISIDIAGKIIELNPAAEKMFGYDRSHALGQEMAQLMIPPYMRDAHHKGLSRYRSTGEGPILGRRTEFNAMRADGTEFPAEVSIVPIQTSGQPVFTGFVRDISDRKQAEEKLFRHTSRLKAIADASQTFAESGLNLNVVLETTAKRLAERLGDACIIRLLSSDGNSLGVSAFHSTDAMVLDHLLTISPKSSMALEAGLEWGVIKTGKAVLMPLMSVETSKSILSEQFGRNQVPFQISSWLVAPLRVGGKIIGTATAFRCGANHPYSDEDLAFLQDLSDRAALAIENSRLFEEAQRAIRLRDDFISIASHELKTPLTSLKMQLQLFSRFIRAGLVVATSQKGQDLLKLVESSDQHISRLSRLVEDMLDVARLSSGRIRPKMDESEVDLSSLVREVVERFRGELAAAKCPLQISAETHVSGWYDRFRIEQVIVNLLTNAMKYGSGKPIRISVSAKGERRLVVVQDFGIGIASEDQDRIFRRFERAVPVSRFGGLGLGLYITLQIVEAHGGQISVESALGKGSTFTVDLPARGASSMPQNELKSAS